MQSLNVGMPIKAAVKPTTNPWHPYTWPQGSTSSGYMGIVEPNETERLRFALELIADGDLRHEDIRKIARKALGKDEK